MRQNQIKAIIVNFLIILVLTALLVLGIIFMVGYMEVNAGTFGQLSLVNFANGYEKIWVFVFYFSDVLFYIIISLLFFEMVLMILRTMIIRGIKTIEMIKKNDLKTIIDKVKIVSLISIFRAMKINTPKRGIIAYAVVMVLVFGSGWVAKTVLNSYDSLVYRSDKIINLYSDEKIVDFANEMTDTDLYDIIIDSDIVNVHIYSVANTNKAKFYYLYDTDEQKAAYTMTIDHELNQIHVVLNQNQDGYEKYVDPVLPSVEMYLPGLLKIDQVDINISIYGSVSMEYVTFSDLILETNLADISVKGEGMMVDSVTVKQKMGKLALTFDHIGNVDLTIENVDASLRLNQITSSLLIDSISSDIFLYQTTANTITIDAVDSELELREVLGQNATITVVNSKLLYVNTKSENPAIVRINSENSELTTKGIKYDQESQ